MKHHILKKKLEKKGWHESHIDKAIETFMEAEEKKHPLLIRLDKLLAWLALVASIIITFVVSLAMIPIYMVMPTYVVVICLAFFGLCFGVLLDILIRETDYFSHHHYILAWLFIPAVSIVNMYFISRMSNIVSIYFPTGRSHSIFLLGAAYVFFFCLPHLGYKYMESKDFKE